MDVSNAMYSVSHSIDECSHSDDGNHLAKSFPLTPGDHTGTKASFGITEPLGGFIESSSRCLKRKVYYITAQKSKS